MASFRVHLVGQHHALDVDLPFADLYELMEEVVSVKFVAGHISEPDEYGVYRRVMIATSRIQCVIEIEWGEG